jgi:hypothetical protein
VALYTFIANYGLGTYLDQREAPTVGAAVHAYARNSDFSFLTGLSADQRTELSQALTSCSVEAAGNLRNVWACAVPVNRELFHVTVVLGAGVQASAT